MAAGETFKAEFFYASPSYAAAVERVSGVWIALTTILTRSGRKPHPRKQSHWEEAKKIKKVRELLFLK